MTIFNLLHNVTKFAPKLYGCVLFKGKVLFTYQCTEILYVEGNCMQKAYIQFVGVVLTQYRSRKMQYVPFKGRGSWVEQETMRVKVSNFINNSSLFFQLEANNNFKG